MQDLNAALSQQHTSISKVVGVPGSVTLDGYDEDKLDRIDAFLGDADSLKSLNFSDGPPVIRPRPYQKEMFEESLEKNIIVTVSTADMMLSVPGLWFLRWTLVLARLICKFTCSNTRGFFYHELRAIF